MLNILLFLLNEVNLNGKQVNCLVSQPIENRPLRGHEVTLETQKCKSNESIPCKQSPHLFVVCIFIIFPWLSKATDTTSMKRPGNTNDKIRNLR